MVFDENTGGKKIFLGIKMKIDRKISRPKNIVLCVHGI